MRFATAYLLAFCAFLSVSRAQVPVYEVTPVESSIAFASSPPSLSREPSLSGTPI